MVQHHDHHHHRQHHHRCLPSLKLASSLLGVAVVSALDTDTAALIAKILETIGQCQAKVIKEGEEAQNMYADFAEWCEDRATEVAHC